MGVADENDSEHIYIFGVKLGKSCDFDFLLISARLTDKAHRRFGRALLQEQFHQAVQLPVAAIGLGVIDGSDEIARCSSLDAAFDDFPRRHQVAQRNDAQVMADRSTQQ